MARARDFQDWDAGLHRGDSKSLQHYGIPGMRKGVRRDELLEQRRQMMAAGKSQREIVQIEQKARREHMHTGHQPSEETIQNIIAQARARGEKRAAEHRFTQKAEDAGQAASQEQIKKKKKLYGVRTGWVNTK